MKRIVVVGFLAMWAFVLAGCGGGAEETPTPAWETEYEPVVSVTGEVVPALWAHVSAQAGGTVLELLVEPGDEVEQGQILMQLDPTDARLAVRQAEAAVEAAQAQLALLEASARPEEIDIAEAQLEAARAALSQATAQRDQLAGGASEAEIAAARAQVAAAEAEWLAAREAHDQTMRCYELPDGSETCPLLGAVEEQARYALRAAEEALAAAQANLDALLAGADDQLRAAEAAVWTASAQRDIAEAQLALLQAGATAEQVGVSAAAVSQAEAAMQAAQVALDRAVVRAPFAGTIGALYTRVGELVVPGQPLATVGDLATLRVETTDLDEIDVGRVAVGQQVSIVFDVTDETFTGEIARIYPMAAPGSGGVSYTAVIQVRDLDPAVRWGMTAFVDIQVGQ